MFYRLQDVIFLEFNIVQDIYELVRFIQLKENHYKRIDDVTSRKRSNAIATVAVEIETKAMSNCTINITTISISINEKTESILAESTVWNLNQYRSSNFRTSNIFKTSNLDSIREELMKAKKCFNCDESNHLSKNCSKSKKFRVVEMNVRNDTKKSKKE
jgi:N-acetylglucosamine kinase-like BadF-type ATPase